MCEKTMGAEDCRDTPAGMGDEDEFQLVTKEDRSLLGFSTS